jgi:hypothetical protein
MTTRSGLPGKPTAIAMGLAAIVAIYVLWLLIGEGAYLLMGWRW